VIFISFGKFRKKPSKEAAAGVTKMIEDMEKHGNKVRGFYWTLGRYDTVLIFEAPNERVAMELSIGAADVVSTETLVAIPREDAIKLL